MVTSISMTGKSSRKRDLLTDWTYCIEFGRMLKCQVYSHYLPDCPWRFNKQYIRQELQYIMIMRLLK
jgi:hypothetical protein